jgi:hypothetical protein
MNIFELKSQIDALVESAKSRQLGKTEAQSINFQIRFEILKCKIVVHELISVYQYEKNGLHIGGTEIGVDHKLLESIETLINYFGNEEEINEFNLKIKNL